MDNQSNSSPIVKVAQREWSRIKFRWPYLFVTLIGPLFAFFLVSWIFTAGVPRNLSVSVVDEDHSSISRQIIRSVDATAIAAVRYHHATMFEARSAMEQGKVDAIVYIPSDCERSILRQERGSVSLFVNNVNVVKGGLLNSGIRKALSTLSAGIKLRAQWQKGLNTDQAMSNIMPVQLKSEILFNPWVNYSYYLSAALMPVILIVFTLLGTMYSLGSELYQGSSQRWLRVANDDIRVAVLGKLLPYTVIYFCMAMVMNLILFTRMGMPLRGNMATIMLSELLLILSYQAFALFIIGLSGNLRLSMSIGGAYCMLALTFSGLSFPAMGMPAFAQAFSYMFPFTYWLKVLIGQSLRGEPAANAYLYMSAMWLFIILGCIILPRLKYFASGQLIVREKLQRK